MSKSDAPEAVLVKPTEPGIYWARSYGYKYWHLMVRVYGDFPYLHLDIYDFNNHKIYVDTSFVDIKEFGPPLHIGGLPDVGSDRKDFYLI